MQIDEVIAEITQRCRNYGAQKIILFGSRAKGTATERSDIDIAVSGVASSDIFELEEALEDIPTSVSMDTIRGPNSLTRQCHSVSGIPRSLH